MNDLLKKVASILILLLLVVAIVYVTRDKEDESDKIVEKATENFATDPVGKEAPNFTLKDKDGNVVSLADYKGKKVLVNMWATWCDPCKEEVPIIEKFYKANPDIVILAVNIDPTDDLQDFMTEYNMTVPVLLDENQVVSKAYGTYKIPETYFIDSTGVVTHKSIGALNYKDLQTLVNIMK